MPDIQLPNILTAVSHSIHDLEPLVRHLDAKLHGLHGFFERSILLDHILIPPLDLHLEDISVQILRVANIDKLLYDPIPPNARGVIVVFSCCLCSLPLV